MNNLNYLKLKNNNYINQKKYEKFVPINFKDLIQFVCWKIEWKQTKKAFLDLDGKAIRDKRGDLCYLPLFDDRGFVILKGDKSDYEIDGKYIKVYYNPNVPNRHASATKPETWGDYASACKVAREKEFDGIGIALNNNVIGIVLDNAFVKLGKDVCLKEHFKDIVNIADSYTEYTPSKTGLKIFMFGKILRNKENSNERQDLKIHNSSSFLTLTGDIYGSYKKAELKTKGSKKIKEIYKKYMLDENNKKNINNFSKEHSYKTSKKSFNKKESITAKKISDEQNAYNSKTYHHIRNYSNETIIQKLIDQGEKKSKQEFINNWYTKKQEKNDNFGINIEKHLLEGNWEGLYRTHNHADFSLVGKIMVYTIKIKQIEEIFKSSGLYREKWDEFELAPNGKSSTYGKNLINKLIMTKVEKLNGEVNAYKSKTFHHIHNYSNETIIQKLIDQGEKKSQKEYIINYYTHYKIKNPKYKINIEKNLLEGNWESLYKSHSEADFSLVGKIIFYTIKIKQIDEIFKSSGLYREKWDEYRPTANGEPSTYGENLIKKILKSEQEKEQKNAELKK